jgi:hypothetical protein
MKTFPTSATIGLLHCFLAHHVILAIQNVDYEGVIDSNGCGYHPLHYLGAGASAFIYSCRTKDNRGYSCQILKFYHREDRVANLKTMELEANIFARLTT